MYFLFYIWYNSKLYLQIEKKTTLGGRSPSYVLYSREETKERRVGKIGAKSDRAHGKTRFQDHRSGLPDLSLSLLHNSFFKVSSQFPL